MHIVTAGSSGVDVLHAATAASVELDQNLNNPPQLLMVFHTETNRVNAVTEFLNQRYPHTRVVTSSSCLGSVTDNRLLGFGSACASLWAVDDALGAYGAGYANLLNNVEASTLTALEDALVDADRSGELPNLVWVHSSPGQEEAVVATIDDYFGGGVPIVGGSVADNQITGRWSVSCGGEVGHQAVVVTVMFPSVEVSTSFQSGYSTTSCAGVVTACDDRTIHTIDDRPAALVYNEWTDGLIHQKLGGDNTILDVSAMHPLGRKVGRIHGDDNTGPQSYFSLLHPERIGADGSLSLFASVSEGERLQLMFGSTESLVNRASDVAEDVLRNLSTPTQPIAGALLVYCAGCMLQIQDHLKDIVSGVSSVTQNAPLAGTFTFGEQGCFVGGENRHGNLMISMVVFGGRRAA